MSSTLKLLRGFVVSEEGLVTVEWVALAGAIVVGAIAVGWLVMNSMSTPATAIGTTVGTAQTHQNNPNP
jgi:Flp pilus assembly pilin Flp